MIRLRAPSQTFRLFRARAAQQREHRGSLGYDFPHRPKLTPPPQFCRSNAVRARDHGHLSVLSRPVAFLLPRPCVRAALERRPVGDRAARRIGLIFTNDPEALLAAVDPAEGDMPKDAVLLSAGGLTTSALARRALQ
jgi:hypothetical protein